MPEPVETKKKRSKCCCCDCCFPKVKRFSREEMKTDLPQVNKAADAVYVKDINEPLKPGSCIVIRGTVKPHCKRFAINLLHVRGPKLDIVFHFNPRLALRWIVRNSLLNSSWGEEEITTVEKFHLDRNKTFELQIVASEHEFLVALDGRHICAYTYRTSLEKVNKIEVDGFEVEGVEIMRQIKTYPSVEGAIDVESLNTTSVDVYPSATSAANVPFTIPLGNVSNGDDSPEQNLVVPVTAKFPCNFKVGWQLEVVGKVKILPSAFYINLQQGDKLWPHPVIPLHLNPRFYTAYGNHLFVRNSWINGQWDTEERTPGFQFTPGKLFHLAVRMNPDNFGVWIDGTLAGEFRFRTPVDNIDTVYIHGDLHVKSVHLKDYIDDKYFSQSREKLSNYSL
ncbi:galectin-8-like isoform X3 [Euwallacea fornicatus]|uniref:galectin-8-like isoform X3 n=1 Tax=Euwallacea fornicatus TaxID=995702 RepID=UPI00338EE822